MKKQIAIILLIAPILGYTQSKTTQQFHEEHESAFVLFFYNNTLKMLNMEDNAEFDELIKDIDKMKFIRVDKKDRGIDKNKFQQLVNQYHREDFEDLMTMRQEGMNINVYIKEKKGITSGLVLLMDDDESLSILDIKGNVPLNKLANLVSQVQGLEGF
ncbi:MAG: DUF4252 domain-containing protein [Cytophagales bacterium]|nr:DUF4252 domain-containing protein [Cytophagales bacterium]